MALIIKIRKSFKRPSRKKDVPDSVSIYTIDSETKKRQGYYTTYARLPGRLVYGVTFRGWYEQGLLHGTVFHYSMFYPQDVLPNQYFNMSEAINYMHGKKNGPSTEYDRHQRPIAYRNYHNNKLTYAHIFTRDTDIFDCAFVSNIPGIGRNVINSITFSKYKDDLYTEINCHRFTDRSENVGKYIRRKVIDGSIKIVADVEYNKYGVALSGKLIHSDRYQTFSIINDKVTRYALELEELKPNNTTIVCVESKSYTLSHKLIHRNVRLNNHRLWYYIGIMSSALTSGCTIGHHLMVQSCIKGELRCAITGFRDYRHITLEHQKLLTAFVLATTC